MTARISYGRSTNARIRGLVLATISLTALFFFAGACDSSPDNSPTPLPTASEVTPTPSVTSATPTTASSTRGPLISDEPGLPAAVSNRIAFAAEDGAIYVVRPDGSDLRRISQDPDAITLGILSSFYIWPVWSPDARHMLITAVSSDASGGFETSLLRVSAAGGDIPELMYLDVPGSDGIGGVAHYPSWSPSANSIAVIANIGDNLATFLLDRERGFTGQAVSNGSPVYLDWSADSGHMLVHTSERLILHQFGPDGTRIDSTVIGSGSVSYRTPDFSPVADEFLYVDVVDGVRSVFIGTLDGTEPAILTDGDTSTAMKWSPNGELIAIARSGRAGIYERLDLIDRKDSQRSFSISDPRSLLAFWWSPDGEKLLLAFESSDGLRDEIELTIANVSDASILELGRFAPSTETWFMMEFFDQYTNDHGVWSPDSTSLAFAGFPRGDLAERARVNGSEPLDSPDPKIWVIDATGGDAPLSVGVGGFATWSPR